MFSRDGWSESNSRKNWQHKGGSVIQDFPEVLFSQEHSEFPLNRVDLKVLVEALPRIFFHPLYDVASLFLTYRV